jgi:hypothetical protein
LMSIINLATALADNLGSYLFTDVFHRKRHGRYIQHIWVDLNQRLRDGMSMR